MSPAQRQAAFDRFFTSLANAVAADASGSGLVELGGTADAALRRAEKWAETGKGPAPVPAQKIKRKV